MPPKRQPWTCQRVTRELEQFIASRDTGDPFEPPRWPTYREFKTAGRKHLWNNAQKHGGSVHWANELGVLYDPRPGARCMTEAQLRGELHTFLRVRLSETRAALEQG